MTTRRTFLKTSAATAGLSLGIRLEAGPSIPEAEHFQPSAWLRMGRDGRARLVVAKTEMGQGVRTSLPAILADELDLPWDQVDLEQASPGPDFLRLQTGGSTSVTSLFVPLRKAAAQARLMLMQAAAARWGVAPEACQTEPGFVRNPITGKKLAYGALVAEAARLPVPAEAPFRQGPRRLVGRDLRRKDAAAFASGKARYGQDHHLPGAVSAVLARCPVPGGTLKAWKGERARTMEGVVDLVPLPHGVAVLARHLDQALAARDTLELTWEPGPAGSFDSERHRQDLRTLLEKDGEVARREGDAAGFVAAEGERLVEAVYHFPFQAHAGLEAPAAHVLIRKDGTVEVWAGTQSPNKAQAEVAEALGLKPEQVKVNVLLVGGGFGRRLSSEFIVEAARIAKASGRPVKLAWTREDDFLGERYHPMSLHRMRAVVDAQGRLKSWGHRIAAASILFSWERGKRSSYLVATETSGGNDIPYEIPNLLVDYREAPMPLPLGWWRAIEVVPNIMAREAFFDEVADAMGRDPLDLRLDLLAKAKAGTPAARLRTVLEKAAEAAGWRAPRKPGRALGLACVIEGSTCVAEVAEVSLGGPAGYRVHRVTAAVDCGLVVNPRSVAGQVEGGIAWALSALRTQATFREGRIQEVDYSAFPVLPLSEMPEVEVLILPSEAHPTGMGEPPVPPCIPAVLSALSRLTGRRLRQVPLKPEDLHA